jgi:hypothetical protein
MIDRASTAHDSRVARTCLWAVKRLQEHLGLGSLPPA